jgi:hypothetical protein
MTWCLLIAFAAVMAMLSDIHDDLKRRNQRDINERRPMSRDEEIRQKAMEFWGTSPGKKPNVGEYGPLGKRIV